MTYREDRATAGDQGMLLAWWAAQGPDRPALFTAYGDRTYGELNANINRLARALRARGLGVGDSVALMCTNRPEFIEVFYAAQRAGLRLTPINWHLTGEEAAYIVDNCEAKAFIGAAVVGDKIGAATGGGGAGGGGTGAGGAGAGGGTGRDMVRLAVGGAAPGFESYEAVIAAEEGSDITDPVLGTQMLYTSGTTGRPKGVHRDGPAPSALATVNFCGYDEDWAHSVDAHLCTGPLYHAARLAFSVAVPMIYGVPLVIMDQWDPVETLRLIEAHRITHTHMVPTMFHRLLALPEEVRGKYDHSSLRFVIHGAAPCPVDVKARLIEWLGPIVVEYYAATEGLGTLVDSATWLAHPGTVGRPMVPGLVRVMTEAGGAAGDEAAPGEIGLVYLRAQAASKFDYYGDADKTAGAFRGDYFTLGDLGYMDDEGYLFLTDRTANLIISGGVNIYPAEVDAILLQHAAVGDVATIGVPDTEWGEAVKAVVQPADGVEGTPELGRELMEFCREHLAHFKCPRSVDFTDQLPREDTGKIYKRLLRDQYRAAAAESNQ